MIDTAQYGFIVTSCGSSGKSPLTILRGRISKPRQESAPHKVTMNHNMEHETGAAPAPILRLTSGSGDYELLDPSDVAFFQLHSAKLE